MKKVYNIEIDCAVCARKCEDAIKKIDGVTSVSVNFINQKMTLEAADEVFDKVYKAAVKAAKKVEPDFEVND